MSITIGPFSSGEVPEPIVYVFQDANGTPIDLTTYTATFRLSINGATGVELDAEVTDADAGEVTYEWEPGDLAAGALRAEFVVSNGTNTYVSERLVAHVRAAIEVA